MIIVDKKSSSNSLRDCDNNNNNASNILAPALEDISCSELGLRGYNEKTWLPSSSVSSFNLTVSSILSHSFCPRCAFIAFRERRYIESAQSVEGQIKHFVIEQFLAKETDFVQSRDDYNQIDYHLCTNFLETLKNNAKERFGHRYNKLGGDFESVWSKAEHILKKRFAKLFFISDIPKREYEILLFSKHLRLSGRLDVLEKGAIPVEIKTGRPPSGNAGYYLSHGVQLALYALLIEDKYFIDVDAGYIYYSSVDERRLVNIDYTLRKQAIWQRDNALHTFQNGKEPEGKCEKCREAENTIALCSGNNSKIQGNDNDNNSLNKTKQEMNTSCIIVIAQAKRLEKIY